MQGQVNLTTFSTFLGYLRGGDTMHSPHSHWRYAQGLFAISYASKQGFEEEVGDYLATLREEKEDAMGEPMLKAIQGVLDEFEDMMP